MLAVSASELAAIQAEAASTLDQSCDIYPHVAGSDSYGSPVNSWPTKSATVACSMSQPTAGQLANYDYVIGDKAAWQVKFPVGTALNHQDHLVIDGETLEVHVLLQPRSYQALLTVIAVEIK